RTLARSAAPGISQAYVSAWPARAPANVKPTTVIGRVDGGARISSIVRAPPTSEGTEGPLMQADEVRKAGVVGYGLMGSGIAEVLAGAGIEVAVLEPTEALLAAGRERIEASTARAVARGKMDEADRAALLDRVHGTTEAIGFADVDLVIEAATEDEPAKVAIFRSLDEVTKPEVVLASNTSSIPIATL